LDCIKLNDKESKPVAQSISKPTKSSLMKDSPYQSCIQACLECAATCNHCAASCTQEEDIKMMARCIQLDMECAALCYASAQVMSLGGSKAKEICKLCADICAACGDECAEHDAAHCQECAKQCKQCAEECRRMAA